MDAVACSSPEHGNADIHDPNDWTPSEKLASKGMDKDCLGMSSDEVLFVRARMERGED